MSEKIRVTRAHIEVEDARRIHLVGELADDLRQWSSLYSDLLLAERALAELKSIEGPIEPHLVTETPIVMWALWNAAVITYARCFSSGARYTKGRELEGALNATTKVIHRKLIQQRGEYIAHQDRSTEEWEQLQAFVYLEDIDAGLNWTVEALGDRYSYADGPFLDDALRLVREQRDHANERRQKISQAIIDDLNERELPDIRSAFEKGEARMPSGSGA